MPGLLHRTIPIFFQDFRGRSAFCEVFSEISRDGAHLMKFFFSGISEDGAHLVRFFPVFQELPGMVHIL